MLFERFPVASWLSCLWLLASAVGCQGREATIQEPVASEPAASSQPIVIDFYADLVCPWCFIGAERLERAIAASEHGTRVVVRHRTFLLSPDTPKSGVNVQEMLRQRYGREPRELFAAAEAAARESGIPLDLMKQPFNYPTDAAHILLRHAERKGTQRALKLALFRAHFLEGLNISDTKVLTLLAAEHGFSPDEVRRIVEDPVEHEGVRAEAQQAQRRGVRGVPYFVFDDREVISGAQSEAALIAAIQRAAQR